MKLSVAYQGGTRYDILSDRHRVVTDQPVEDGGADAGMSPVELFVGSVASCVGYFVGQFCARHDISREGLKIDAYDFRNPVFLTEVELRRRRIRHAHLTDLAGIAQGTERRGRLGHRGEEIDAMELEEVDAVDAEAS